MWFTPTVTTASGYPLTGGILGTPVTHPEYADFAGFPNTRDLGLVLLSAPVRSPTYGCLPDEGALDTLATRRGLQEVDFTVVGYGLQEVRPDFQADRERYQGTVRLVNLRSALTGGFNLHHSSNPGHGGGTCFGDSGGPIFLGDSNVVVAVTSFVLNTNCKGAGFGYRTDLDTAQDFILPYLGGFDACP